MHEIGFMQEQIANAEIQNVVRQMVVESEQKYKTLVENSPVGIIIYSDDHIVYANPRLEQMFGYTAKEYKKVKIWDLIHPDQREMVRERAYRRLSGKDDDPEYETRALKKDGTYLDIFIKPVRMMYKGKPAMLVNIVDITDFKSAQREVRELSTIVQTALLPIFKLDPDGRILYLNKSAEKFLGIELKEIKGQPLHAFLTGVEPEEMQEHVIKQTRKGGIDSVILFKKHSGAPAKMRLTTCPLINDSGQMTAMACFLIDPELNTAERNLLNAEDPFTPDRET